MWLYELPLITLGVVDASESRSTVGIRLRAGTDVLAAHNAANQFANRVSALSGATIDHQYVVYRGAESPQPAAPGLTSYAGTGVFVFSTTEPGEYAIVQLPAIRPALLLTTGPGAGVIIDQAAPEVTALAEAMISGSYCNPFGYPLAALESAFLQYRP